MVTLFFTISRTFSLEFLLSAENVPDKFPRYSDSEEIFPNIFTLSRKYSIFCSHVIFFSLLKFVFLFCWWVQCQVWLDVCQMQRERALIRNSFVQNWNQICFWCLRLRETDRADILYIQWYSFKNKGIGLSKLFSIFFIKSQTCF